MPIWLKLGMAKDSYGPGSQSLVTHQLDAHLGAAYGVLEQLTVFGVLDVVASGRRHL